MEEKGNRSHGSSERRMGQRNEINMGQIRRLCLLCKIQNSLTSFELFYHLLNEGPLWPQGVKLGWFILVRSTDRNHDNHVHVFQHICRFQRRVRQRLQKMLIHLLVSMIRGHNEGGREQRGKGMKEAKTGRKLMKVRGNTKKGRETMCTVWRTWFGQTFVPLGRAWWHSCSGPKKVGEGGIILAALVQSSK